MNTLYLYLAFFCLQENLKLMFLVLKNTPGWKHEIIGDPLIPCTQPFMFRMSQQRNPILVRLGDDSFLVQPC